MPGQDQVNASGVSIFARCRRPLRYRNPDRVYSADCRPCRDLNRGYRARLAKNAAYATCWCRIACWSGTEDTSFSQASSSVAFMAVRWALAWVKVVPVFSAWYRWCRHARVRFHTTRTHPNVRFSTLACAWSGYARHLYAILTTRKLIRLNPDM